MARKKDKTYIISVEKNAEYCGEGAGGAQFARGKATITSDRLANWYKEHDGYKVEEVKASESAEAPDKKEDKAAEKVAEKAEKAEESKEPAKK